MGALPLGIIRATNTLYTRVKVLSTVEEKEEEPQSLLESRALSEVNENADPSCDTKDEIVQDWKWLALRCEQRLMLEQYKRNLRVTELKEDSLKSNSSIERFCCFVPRIVIEAIADKRIRHSDDFDIIVECFEAAVVFCDASGFTSLTETLEKEPSGAEKLGEAINSFFNPLIRIVTLWGGDIIKFSGDAVTIVWPVDDAAQIQRESPQANINHAEGFGSDKRNKFPVQDITSYYKIDRLQACKLACKCCIELHKNLNSFPTPVENKFFNLHIGVGYGNVTILQVGGTLDRWEYVVAGPPLQEISIAEHLAQSGETVISPTVADALNEEKCTVLEFIELEAFPRGYAKLISVKNDTEIYPPPPLESIKIVDSDVIFLKRFIQPVVFKRLTRGHSVFINELRMLSVIFVSIQGLEVSSNSGSSVAHELMLTAQRAVYAMEGSINKFFVDDKGIIILIFFGLPPVYHADDAIRAVMTAIRMVDALKALGLTGSLGVATGRVWCGTVGCELRKEYTAIGGAVNLASRLMTIGGQNNIYCDNETKILSEPAMEFISVPPVLLKGIQGRVPVFSPTGRMNRKAALQTTPEEPIRTWKKWKYLDMVHDFFYPGYEYRKPVLNFDKTIPDIENSPDPLNSWEYIEQWLPSLKPTVDLGGVVAIVGKDTAGTAALIDHITVLCERLGRKVFRCSNMPDSMYINIGNVYLLAWRKLCTEIIKEWRTSSVRKKKGYTPVDKNYSVYNLTKELTNPIFHWRLHEMKSEIQGLVLPHESTVKENDVYLRGDGRNENESFVSIDAKSRNSRASLGSASGFDGMSFFGRRRVSNCSKFQPESHHNKLSLSGPFLARPYVSQTQQQSLAPIICSLVNGFSMNQLTVVCLHVRSGTSLFASMDSESWKVARLLAEIAMWRRRRNLELEVEQLKNWRRDHSRNCVWCKESAFNDSNALFKDNSAWSTNCTPPQHSFYPAFLFVAVFSDVTGHIIEQQDLLNWAKECNSLIRIKRLSIKETASYLAHCLLIDVRSLPPEVVKYVHRISAGIPKYIFETAKKLLLERAISINRFNLLTSQKNDCLVTKSTLSNISKKDKLARRRCDSLPLSITAYQFARENDEGNGEVLPFFLFTKGTSCSASGVDSMLSRNTLSANSIDEKSRKYRCFSNAHRRVSAQYWEHSLLGRKESSELLGDHHYSDEAQHCAGKEISKEAFETESVKVKIRNIQTIVVKERVRKIGQFHYVETPFDDARESNFSGTSRDFCLTGFGENGYKGLSSFFGSARSGDGHSNEEEADEVDNKEDCTDQERHFPCSFYEDADSFLPTFSLEQNGVTISVQVNKDLDKVPFPSEICAASISVLEQLEPEEALAVKIASLFPHSFALFELRAVYPGDVTSAYFKSMIQNLISKDILERCYSSKLEKMSPEKPGWDSFAHNDRKSDLFSSQLRRNLEIIERFYGQSESEFHVEKYDKFFPTEIDFNKKGHLIFYHFASSAFPNVVSESLISSEKIILRQMCRLIINRRRSTSSLDTSQVSSEVFPSKALASKSFSDSFSDDGLTIKPLQ